MKIDELIEGLLDDKQIIIHEKPITDGARGQVGTKKRIWIEEK